MNKYTAIILIGIMGLWFSGGESFGAVTFDASSTFTGAVGNGSTTHTIGSGGNRLLIFISAMANGGTFTSSSFGGVDMTLYASTTTGTGNGNLGSELWYVLNPPVGAGTIQLNNTGGNFVGIGYSFFGTTGFGNVTTSTLINQNANTIITRTASSTVGNLVVDAYGEENIATDITVKPVQNAAQTLILSQITSNVGAAYVAAGASYRDATAASTTMSWTAGNGGTKDMSLFIMELLASVDVATSSAPTTSILGNTNILGNTIIK